MTAGQGGPEEQGQQPPSYPSYGQPGPGQQPPGYMPAPSAQNWAEAPPPMERPTSVRVGIGAFIATLILGLIAAVVQFADPDEIVDRIREADPSISEDLARTTLTVGLVIGLLLVALQALFIWLAWQGRNWARIVLLVLGGISVVFGLVGLSAGQAATADGFLASLSVFQWVLTLVGIVFLAQRSAAEWYRNETRRRLAGR